MRLGIFMKWVMFNFNYTDMKKLVLMLSLMVGATAAVNAQDTTRDQSTQYRTDTTATDDMDTTSTQLDTAATQNESQYRTDEQGEMQDTTSLNQDQSNQDQSSSEDQSSSTGEQPSPNEDNEDAATQDQSTQDQDQSAQYRDDQDQGEDMTKEEISVAELPATVSTQLESSDYRGWSVDKAFKKMKDGQTIYAVELKQGDEVKKVKFDAQGNVLKSKEKKDNDQ
jgi:hypothetical protein